ncbi:unnamed protein product [Pleuronectes platessa]|uniref:Uncharacterized protein n=1 Tax=Pleuronectes platessa TaxID=8262 RepID=A0A9N7UFA1_PLEPL|nr:unnamed protein product [Pleuronectes platessa]
MCASGGAVGRLQPRKALPCSVSISLELAADTVRAPRLGSRFTGLAHIHIQRAGHSKEERLEGVGEVVASRPDMSSKQSLNSKPHKKMGASEASPLDVRADTEGSEAFLRLALSGLGGGPQSLSVWSTEHFKAAAADRQRRRDDWGDREGSAHEGNRRRTNISVNYTPERERREQ